MVKKLLGHKNVVTTQEYLRVSYSKLKKGCDRIPVSRLNTNPALHNSLAEIEADTMILDLVDVVITSMPFWKEHP